jgi:hypothetical protein
VPLGYCQLLSLQLVTVNFWVLNSLLDPALIEDTQVLQDYVPSWMNHSLHTTVLLFALVELVLTHRRYPRWTARGRLMAAVVVLAYTSWWVNVTPCGLRADSCTATHSGTQRHTATHSDTKWHTVNTATYSDTQSHTVNTATHSGTQR